MALQDIADEPAHGQREMAMDAAVLQCHRRAVLLAKQHHRLPEEDAPHRLAGDLVIGGGDVPKILEEHGAAHSVIPGRPRRSYHVRGRNR
jgi:hypothetical protein